MERGDEMTVNKISASYKKYLLFTNSDVTSVFLLQCYTVVTRNVIAYEENIRLEMPQVES